MANNKKLIEAIDLALGDEWDAAHRAVQNMDDENAAWVHAVLHKIEGDIGNSKYWYNRAGRPFTDKDPASELNEIKALLG